MAGERIADIVAGLPGTDRIGDLLTALNERASDGDVRFVADLALAAAEADARATEPRVWQYASTVDHVVRLLGTTPGQDSVTLLLRLAAARRGGDPRRGDRYLASLLASGHPPEDLAAVFPDPPPDPTPGLGSVELRTCLVHELVLRDVDVTRTPGIAAWLTSPQWRDHPLARLPLTRGEPEAQPDVPVHSVGGLSFEIAFGPSAHTQRPPAAPADTPPATEVTTPAVADAIAAAVANWADESNGGAEARVFAFARPLDTAAVPAVLPALGLACLEGVHDRAGWAIAAQPPAHAWRILFGAAANGGAYNSGVYGAYGRLAAWQSIAALAGCPDDAPFDAIETRAQACTWFVFDADTAWYWQVAWDIGLAALSPDGRRLAVLAASDTG
ncbi:DUF6183 family protein [Uniformispora flossi]|uniref:DUF6183 family protein n=1 Tax=Uniformispora flossi TaxID=3390723 RepID=UPI003C305612